MSRGPRAVFVVNNQKSYFSHRANWGTFLADHGYEVHVIAKADSELRGDYGGRVRTHDVDLGREGISPRQGVLAAARIFLRLVRLRPQIVILSATAAYTLGWPAALILRRTVFLRVVPGIGRALTPDFRQTRSGKLVQRSFRLASRLSNVKTLFQVMDDAQTFEKLGLVQSRKYDVIPGTGLDLDYWSPGATSRSSSRRTVLFASRLYREKGVHTFVDVARELRTLPGVQFSIAGPIDEGVSSSVSRRDIDQWEREGLISYLGERSDMRDIFRDAELFLFPTIHPEGTPKVLIEAAACGVPVVASDTSGCRAVVIEGATGLLLPADDRQAWVNATKDLLSDPDRLSSMSSNARIRAAEFGSEAVLTALGELLGVTNGR